MKILYIANNNTNDFLSDAVFHGLKCISGVDVYELNHLWYMYNTTDKSSLVNRFHGRGFTYYAELDSISKVAKDPLNLIRDKFFDIIIYGNVRRCLDFFEEVSRNYDKSRIILLDGNDEHNQPGIHTELVSKGVYFRRELSVIESIEYPHVRPISFSFPKSKMTYLTSKKEKVLATIVPGVAHTFIFNDETDYLNDYRVTLFAYTWRKAGWDCLRHYEILGCDCIPIFIDIEHCPSTICTTIPKDTLKDYYKLSGLYRIFEMDKSIEYDNNRTIVINRDLTKINDIEITHEFMELYEKFNIILREYSKTHITTEALAKYVINEINI